MIVVYGNVEVVSFEADDVVISEDGWLPVVSLLVHHWSSILASPNTAMRSLIALVKTVY